MPDQSSAATEHAIMQEITQPLTELPHDPVAAVANADFPVVLRGYDREAVDEYVQRTTQLVAEMSATRSPEGAVRRALERVGEQVSSILGRAHETAEDITSQSRAEAEERLIQARAEAHQLERDARASAEQLERDAHERAQERERAAEMRVRELDAEVERIWAERDRIVNDVRKLSEELSLLSSAAATRFPAATTEDAAAVTGPDATGVAAEPALADAPEPGLHPVVAADPGVDPGFEAWPAPEVAGEVEPELAVGSEPDLREVPADVGDDRFVGVQEEDNADEGALRPFEPDAFDDGLSASEQPTTVLRRPRLRVIDLNHLGRERVIGAWQVDDVLIDPGPASCLEALLGALEEQPRALLLTHIHLDHAGATGSLVRMWPELEVYVHELGAQHLIDPAKLLESARRLYGGDLEDLWGEVLPVPEANLHILGGGEQLLGGSFEVAYTPGHASHHVSYLLERTAFVGDAGGVRITPEELTIPPTPPPEIDIDAWHGSIERILRWGPERLAMTHFGESRDVERQLAELAERLDTWAALVRSEDFETFIDVVETEIESGSSPVHHEAYRQAAPPELLFAGLDRYWRKRDGGAGGPADEPETNETDVFTGGS
ncbi:MAG: MBL fold metallo-hydrolase [Solirubrobacterales bacterium]|nr:MBL fold metallo-hydrolase [Solirubrobacterales bacterium]